MDTCDIDEFLNAINSLAADGGGDCQEPTIGALIRAIRATEPESPIYVFTDSPASDEDRLAEAQALIAERGVRVSFVNIGSSGQCTNNSESVVNGSVVPGGGDAYNFLAAISGGQVLNINTGDISELATLMSFSAMQTYTTIFYKTNSIMPGMYNFPVDETVNVLIISINGNGITVFVTTPEGKFVATRGSYIGE